MSFFIPVENMLGIQPIGTTSTTQNHPVGMEIRAFDQTIGTGEFIYLKGVVGTVVGSLVTYDIANSTTALSPNTANLGQPVAVSMSANVALGFGWYQIGGPAVISKITTVNFLPTVRVYQSATTGSVTSLSAAGKEIVNCRTTNAATVASAVTTINVIIDRPFMQGVIT